MKFILYGRYYIYTFTPQTQNMSTNESVFQAITLNKIATIRDNTSFRNPNSNQIMIAHIASKRNVAIVHVQDPVTTQADASNILLSLSRLL